MKYCRYGSKVLNKFHDMTETVFVCPTCRLAVIHIPYGKCGFDSGRDLVYYFVGYVKITLDVLSIKAGS
jgi:hypothetical protein